MNNPCPCEKCILVGICRFKSYCSLHQDCSLIRKYIISQLKQKKRSGRVFQTIYDTIKPLMWYVGTSTEFDVILDRVKPKNEIPHPYEEIQI